MLKWLNNLIKRNDATTRCAVLPGDIIRISIHTKITRKCDHNGVILGTLTYPIFHVFEWEATRPYRTLNDAIWEAHKAIDVQYVQMKDTI